MVSVKTTVGVTPKGAGRALFRGSAMHPATSSPVGRRYRIRHRSTCGDPAHRGLPPSTLAPPSRPARSTSSHSSPTSRSIVAPTSVYSSFAIGGSGPRPSDEGLPHRDRRPLLAPARSGGDDVRPDFATFLIRSYNALALARTRAYRQGSSRGDRARSRPDGSLVRCPVSSTNCRRRGSPSVDVADLSGASDASPDLPTPPAIRLSEAPCTTKPTR